MILRFSISFHTLIKYLGKGIYGVMFRILENNKSGVHLLNQVGDNAEKLIKM